ncbi:bacillithiol biosynthesis cysteine-adding enzyme BshC [Paenibacillus arenosi]|uniref:Putative cysteine ligase BshC n=1 Tax=Paenibacillus arenosi TaxID=2774142 RepID=A0ABR9ARL0_9BACL|nr:bacillithiol biosynthesis cysteine-adding enzyme BshC [Paenibacillus arenosi]MBD8496753.1 bacillithiol biosynthesis cysteine-adding enzyme BshC [Paenibacillus arenosi]
MTTWDTLPVPVSQQLAKLYIERDPVVVEQFYEFHPDEDWHKRVSWVDEAAHRRADRFELVKVLTQYQQKVNNHPEAIRSLERLQDSQALVVVGGQQGGLLGGPLLVVYKAISIIRMAQEAEQRLERPVIPVFWLAGEDHDFDEVNHTYMLSSQAGIQRIRLEHSPSGRQPVSYYHVDESDWDAVIGQLEELLPATEFKAPMLERYRMIMQESSSLTEACARLLSYMFGEIGLVLLDSADEHLRALEGPLFKSIIQQQDALQQAYAQSEQRMRAAGYPIQADHAEESANLFVLEQGERVLLMHQEGVFADRKRTIQYSQAQLEQLTEQHPERFSNNVMTRPLMQEYLFPVLATVLGAGEIAYWAQTKDAFSAIGMKMPIIWPRMAFTCVEGTLQKLLNKYELQVEHICNQYEAKRNEWLASQDELKLDERFAQLRGDVEHQYAELLSVLNQSLPTLGKLGDMNRDKVLEQIDYLHNRSQDALKKQHESGLRQWERLKLALWPLDRPQERVFNMALYENRYGADWYKVIMDAPVVWQGEHRLVSM